MRGLVLNVSAALVAIGLGFAASRGAAGWLLAGVVASGVLMVTVVAKGYVSPAQGLCVAAFLLPMNNLRPAGVGALGDAVLLVSGLCLLPLGAAPIRIRSLLTVLTGMGIVLIAGLVGMVATQNWSDVEQVARFFLGGPVVVAITALLIKSRREAIPVLAAYTSGVLVSVATAALQFQPNGRVGGLAVAAAALAISSTFALTFLLGHFLAQRYWGLRRVSYGCAAVFAAYGVFLAGGRSGLVGLLLVMVVLACAYGAQGILTVAIALPVGLATVLVAAPYLPNGATIERIFGRGEYAASISASNQEHSATAHRALDVIVHHWATGVGFGPANALNAHSMLLTVTATGGILALLGLGLILLPFVREAIKNVLRARVDPVSTALLAGSLAFIQTAQLHPQLWDRYVWFWMTLTLIVACEPTVTPEPSSHERRIESSAQMAGNRNHSGAAPF